MTLKARLAAVEARLRKAREPGLYCTTIQGGLEPNGHENFAHIGGVLFQREANETVDAFQHRVRETALASGHNHVVFGGLPRMPCENHYDANAFSVETSGKAIPCSRNES
jgi:hypothetical protein